MHEKASYAYTIPRLMISEAAIQRFVEHRHSHDDTEARRVLEPWLESLIALLIGQGGLLYSAFTCADPVCTSCLCKKHGIVEFSTKKIADGQRDWTHMYLGR